MISWRVVNEVADGRVAVEILQRHAWRYDFFTPICNDSTIPNKLPKLGSGNLTCKSTCPTGLTLLGSVKVPCTDYSVGEEYAAGDERFKFNVRHNASFDATFEGTGWFN